MLTETADRHHAAYEASDGFDPEWPLWYAPFVHAHLGDRPGEVPTRVRSVHLLVADDDAFTASASQGRWERFYARYMLEH